MAKVSAGRRVVGNRIADIRRVVSTVFDGRSREFSTLIGIIIFTAIFGAVMVFSSSYVDSVKNQNGPFGSMKSELFGMGFGFIALIWFAYIRPESARRFGPILTITFVFLQLVVLLTPLGISVNGNRNWLNLYIFSLQPSEFLKIAMIMAVASMVVTQKNYSPDEPKFWIGPISYFAVLFLLVGLISKDMGTMIVMAAILYGMFYMGGMSSRLVRWMSITVLAGIPLILMLGGSRKGRILAWLFPNNPDPNQYNWQADHGKWAFASGGLFGTGLGNSQMKWSWIPEAQNDFIFAIIGEEWGLVGSLIVIALFVFLGITLFRIAKKTNDQYQRLFVYGVTFWIMSQAFINISVVLTMFPVLGVNLPLISAGGTSMTATLMALGMVLGIERNNHSRPALRVVSNRR